MGSRRRRRRALPPARLPRVEGARRDDRRPAGRDPSRAAGRGDACQWSGRRHCPTDPRTAGPTSPTIGAFAAPRPTATSPSWSRPAATAAGPPTTSSCGWMTRRRRCIPSRTPSPSLSPPICPRPTSSPATAARRSRSITLADGTRRPFAELPDGVGGRVLGVDHATGRLAVIATSNPAATNRGDPAAPDDRLVVFDGQGDLLSERGAEPSGPRRPRRLARRRPTHRRVLAPDARTSRSSGSTAPSTPPSSRIAEVRSGALSGDRLYLGTADGIVSTALDGSDPRPFPLSIARVRDVVAVDGGPIAAPQPTPTAPPPATPSPPSATETPATDPSATAATATTEPETSPPAAAADDEDSSSGSSGGVPAAAVIGAAVAGAALIAGALAFARRRSAAAAQR